MSENRSAAAGVVGLEFISTGMVKIRSMMKSQPATRSVALRRFRSITDRAWTEPLPVGVFLIRHPDGPILFDTGESPCVNDPGYLSAWNPVRFLTETTIERHQGIVEQLKGLGVEPKELQAIVLSHLHQDHAGGLKALVDEAPDVPVYLSTEHWAEVGLNMSMPWLMGYETKHWPENFSPKLLDFKDPALGPWDKSCNITTDGSVVAVMTPGHVDGHVSLVVTGRDADQKTTTYLLPGDATYGIDLLDIEEPDGMNNDPMQALHSLQLMKKFAEEREVVVLPSHDPSTPELLKERVVYTPKNSGA